MVLALGHAEEGVEPAKKASMEQLVKQPADTFTKVIRRTSSPGGRMAVALGFQDGTKPAWQAVEDDGEAYSAHSTRPATKTPPHEN